MSQFLSVNTNNLKLIIYLSTSDKTFHKITPLKAINIFLTVLLEENK